LKKIVSVILLTIFLFNWIGFRLLSSFLECQANDQIESRLDRNDYADSDLISIKIPVNGLAYSPSSERFERVNGQVIINALSFNYVKRRILNDSLEVLCIPNFLLTCLLESREGYFQALGDLPHLNRCTKATNHSTSRKLFSPDNFISQTACLSDNSVVSKSERPIQLFERFAEAFSFVIENPPETFHTRFFTKEAETAFGHNHLL
jgi:hypothetical protein